MGSDRIRLAQLGVGRWGTHLLRNFRALPSVEVVAVVEPQVERHSQIRDTFALGPEVTVTANAEAVLTRPDVQAVAIATPAVTHAALIRTALNQGKHVLAEKPLTLDVGDCEALCQLAAQHQRQLVVDHTYLFHPAVQTGHRLLADQPLGQLRYGYATRTNLGPVRPDVDALWDLAIHDIVIFNHWLGATPSAVAAYGQVWLQRQPSTVSQFPAGLADVVWLRLYYPDGFEATVHVSWANPDKQRRLGVVGDRGTLIFDELQPQTPLVLQQGHFEPEGLYFVPAGLGQAAIAVPTWEPLRQVCQHFVDCIQHPSPSPVSSGEVGTTLVRILTALSESLNQHGRTVSLLT